MDTMKILLWNIRGLGSTVKKRFVSKLIKERGPDVVIYWDSIRFQNLEKFCWQATFYDVISTIWTSRNESVFNNRVWEVDEISDLVKTRMAIWIKGRFNISAY